MNIITVDEADEYLEDQITDKTPPQGTPESMITDISARIAMFLGRKDWGEQALFTEYYDGDTQIIAVKVWPIISITGIWDDSDHIWNDGSKIDTDAYWISQNSSLELNDGIVFYNWGKFAPGHQNVKITYTGGYALVSDIPAIFKRACYLQLAYELKMGDAMSFANVPSQTDGSQIQLGTHLGLLSSVRSLLIPYRRVIPFA